MSTPARSLRGGSSSTKPSLLTDVDRPSLFDEVHGLVSDRAYALFEAAGRADGDDLAHWFQAEREITSFPRVQESADTFSVAIPVGEIPAEQIKVCVTDTNAIVSAKSEVSEDTTLKKSGSSSRTHSFYYMVSWPEDVASDTYKAEVRSELLTLSVSKKHHTEKLADSSAAPTKNDARSTSERKVK